MAGTLEGVAALIDTHAHLDDKAFDVDRPAVLRRAADAGVRCLVAVGADMPSSRRAVTLASEWPDVFATVGVHPHDASTVDNATLAGLERLAREPRVVAIGEIGLDFYRDLSPRDQQRAAFQAQLELAARLDLPVVVHDRDAHGEVLDTLRRWVADYPAGRGVLHCFSGDERMAREAIELGFYISIAGPVTFANAGRLARLAASLPLERIVVETDCPYLTPEPWRGRRNEPAHVRLVAEHIASLRGISLTETARATTANAQRLFTLK